MKTSFLTIFALAVFTGDVLATPETFDFKDPKNGNDAAFKLVAPQETIAGSANGISGSVTFDPENPAATKGKIIVETKSLTVPNGMMRQIMLGNLWLDAAKYPQITFEVKELKNVKTESEKITASAVGSFTLKDVSKELTVPVTLKYLKDKLGDRLPGKKGDLLVVQGSFTILRSDFNVNPNKNEDKVADKIELTLNLAGSSAK